MDIHKQFTVAVAKDEQGNKLTEETGRNLWFIKLLILLWIILIIMTIRFGIIQIENSAENVMRLTEFSIVPWIKYNYL